MLSKFIFARLEKLKRKHSLFINNVRGMGIMIGIELNIEGDEIVKRCRERGLLINCTQKQILRIMPPLTAKKGQAAKAIRILDEVLRSL